MATKYVARFHNEIVGKRTTKDRTYTHAIVVADPSSPPEAKYHAPRVVAWCGRLDLAQKEACRWKFELVEIVPAEVA